MHVFRQNPLRPGRADSKNCNAWHQQIGRYVPGFHGNDGRCDIADAREVAFQFFAMGNGLLALLVVHQERHAVLLRDRAMLEEIGEAVLVRSNIGNRNVELSEDAGNAIGDVGPLMLHDHALTKEIPHGSVLGWQLMRFRKVPMVRAWRESTHQQHRS